MKSSEQFPMSRHCNFIRFGRAQNGPTFGCQIRTLNSKKSKFSLFNIIHFWQFRKADITSDRKTKKKISLHRNLKIMLKMTRFWVTDFIMSLHFTTHHSMQLIWILIGFGILLLCITLGEGRNNGKNCKNVKKLSITIPVQEKLWASSITWHKLSLFVGENPTNYDRPTSLFISTFLFIFIFLKICWPQSDYRSCLE